MAEVKVIITKEEQNEKEEVLKIIKQLKSNDKAKLRGFLQGIAFINK